MSRFDQVMHVFKKDVSRYWPLVGFLGLVLTADAFMPPDETRYIGGAIGSMLGTAGLRGSILTVLMMLITALVIHEDNASHRGSFWSSRPLSPMAVLAAKGLFLGLFLIGLPIAFQTAAILEFGTAQGLPLFLAESAFYHAGLLAMVVAVASVTKDLKATLFLGLAGYAGASVLNSLLSTPANMIRLGQGPDFAIDVFVLGACLAVVAFQYGTRRTREAIVALAVFAVVVPAVAMRASGGPTFGMNAFEVVPLDGAVPVPNMFVQALEFAPGRRSTRGAGIDRIDAVIGTGQTELSIVPRMASLELRVRTSDGRDERSTPRGRLYNPDQRYAPLMPGYDWIGGAQEWAQFDVPVLSAPAGTLAPSMNAIEQIQLETEWDAYDRRVLGRVPFEVGAELVTGSMRIVVAEVKYGPDELEVLLQSSWIASGRHRSDEPPVGRMRVLAVHDGRQEFLLGSSGGNTRNQVPLVLPGPRAVRYNISLRYQLGSLSDSDFVLGADWFDEAAILVYANDYVGSFKSTLDTNLSELAIASRSAGAVTLTPERVATSEATPVEPLLPKGR